MDIVREVAWILENKSVANVEKGEGVKKSEQGSDLIELRLTLRKWRICFFGDL